MLKVPDGHSANCSRWDVIPVFVSYCAEESSNVRKDPAPDEILISFDDVASLLSAWALLATPELTTSRLSSRIFPHFRVRTRISVRC
ncbi:MAG: hypothetical protein CL457_02765 [Acidimicrobiaceae bacterium]|nr:hypothetical protein [Acidimicrobiaceae bacterium]